MFYRHRTLLRIAAAGWSLCPVAFACQAEEPQQESYVAHQRYVSLDTAFDNADSRDASVTGSFTLGNYTWLQATVGALKSDRATALDGVRTFGVGAGVRTASLQFRLDYDRYRSDADYKQQDVRASLDWRNDRVTIGLDGLHRATDNSSDSTMDFPGLNLYNVAIHLDEQLAGTGIGAHLELNVTDNLSFSLSGMSYDYSSVYQLTSSTNPVLIRNVLARRPTIAELLYLNNSGVTRELALLNATYSAGLLYQFDYASLGCQYYYDEALDTNDVTNTIALNLSVLVGEHWLVAPQVGYSSSAVADSVTFGSLSVSYNW